LPFLALSPLQAASPGELFAAGNLHAWCAVPFDAKKRGPEERAEMLEKLRFKHFVYGLAHQGHPHFSTPRSRP